MDSYERQAFFCTDPIALPYRIPVSIYKGWSEGRCDAKVICKSKYDQLEPYSQFFFGFFVHQILQFVVSILPSSVSEDMAYYSLA